MTLRKIIYIPDPRLRVVCKTLTPEEINTPEIQTLIDDMFETMYHAPYGVGLAANQIGVCLKISVIDISDERNQPITIINPEIVEIKNVIKMDESCLSIPGHGCYGNLERGTIAKIRALDRYGKEFELEGEGLLAQALQHETGHLNGKLYIDYLSPLKRHRIQERCAKYLKSKR